MARTQTLKLQYDAEMAVFNNPLLIDHILMYVVFNSHDELLRGSDVAAIRLVARNWLQSTSRIIKKSLCISMEIILGNTNKLHGKPTDKSSKEILENFVSIFGSNSRFSDSLLTLHLGLHEEFFRTENLQCLKSCLECCGESLLILSVRLPVNANFKLPKFEQLNFSIMNRICFHFDEVLTQNENISQGDTNSNAQLENCFEFLQLLLNGAKNLKTLDYVFLHDFGADIKLIESIRLPDTLTQIISCTAMFNWDYALIMKNLLPNLRELRMDIICIPGDEHLFKVLDRLRSSLELLEIDKRFYNISDSSTKCIRFPLLPRLKSLSIQNNKYQKDPNMGGPLSTYLPKLRKFYIKYQTESGWINWIENSRFENVSQLVVNLRKEDDSNLSESKIQSPSLKYMEILKTSFPNLSILRLNLDVGDVTILKALFWEWTQLKELQLIFHGGYFYNTPKLLASMLLGFSLESFENVNRILSLSLDKPSLNVSDVEKEFSPNDSILNLTELNSLTLDSKMRRELPNGAFRNLVALLEIGFKTMPNLKKINFLSGFKIADDK